LDRTLSPSSCASSPRSRHSFPTRRSSDLSLRSRPESWGRRLVFPAADDVGREGVRCMRFPPHCSRPLTHSLTTRSTVLFSSPFRSEEHTSELQSRENLVCRLLLEKKKTSA